jgi:hypothetical protein
MGQLPRAPKAGASGTQTEKKFLKPNNYLIFASL